LLARTHVHVHDRQDGPGVDLLAGLDEQLGHRPVIGRADAVLHLHRLEHEQYVPGGHGLPLAHRHPQHRARHRRHQRADREIAFRQREARVFDQRGVAERRVDVKPIDQERATYAVDRKVHPIGHCGPQVHV